MGFMGGAPGGGRFRVTPLTDHGVMSFFLSSLHHPNLVFHTSVADIWDKLRT